MTDHNDPHRLTPDTGAEKPFTVSAPAVQLPRGGGALRGLGEKYAANPVTGTGSMSVPIATSPGRSGFGPQLALSYDSGAGNGPFGFGWRLSIPTITRKTDKGLPRYDDGKESDVFLLSGVEDLVPVLESGGDQFGETITLDGVHYAVCRYRPRIEGLFARIERWTNVDDVADVHWRSISRDNLLTLYGKDANSRIADPEHPERIFSWLICETRDDKGNAVVYQYKAEDGTGVDLSQAHQRNRGDRDDLRRAANRYLKRIHYGNRSPLLDESGQRPPLLTTAQFQSAGWMFEVVFDYDDHDPAAPAPRDDEAKDATGALKYPWTHRQDSFSTYRAGFEVRTTRLCQRVLMFHHFPAEDGVGAGCLVRSTDLTYSYEQNPHDARNPVYSFLLSVTHTGYKRASGGGYLSKSLPPVEFEYTQPTVQDRVEEVDPASLDNLPIGLDGTSYQWTDLHGEGIPGILSEQAGAWFYKRNLSPINVQPGNGTPRTEAKFAPVELVATKPNLALANGAQFMDLAGDGQPDLVVLDGPMPGLYEHDGAEGWQPFRPFSARLNRDTRDPNLKFVDLDGDGYADVLITEDDAFVWHPSLAEEGFGPAHRVVRPLDEEQGPRLVFADGTQSIYLSDMSGDGLADLVRIRNGEICYWPNLGYGRFGARVTMDNLPCLDHPDQFDHKRIRLADIDGSGTTDIIYLHGQGVRLCFNQCGNSWSAPQILRVFPRVDDLVNIVPTDLLGNGTACLVWSSPLPGDARRPMRYVNLMGAHKPHLLVKTVNNLGAETRVQYAPSTRFYLQAKRDGKPWITRLPFPVHVVERVETYDRVSGNRFVTRYAYHHGYFDGEEREFRGFGMVEQWDTEEIGTVLSDQHTSTATNLDAASYVPPVLTRTWFHTGIYLDRDRVSRLFAGLRDGKDRGEYYRERAWLDDDDEAAKRLLPDTVLPDDLSPEEERAACRALKGSMLRQEVYALDGIGQEADYPDGQPYTVVEQNFAIRRLQSRGGNRHAVFFTHPREALTYRYERDETGPRIQHALTLEVDAYGNVRKEAAIGYGRPQSPLPEQWDKDRQETTLVTFTENVVTKPIDDGRAYRTPLPAETRTYELTGYELTGAAGRYRHEDFVQPDPDDPTRLAHIHEGEATYEATPPAGKQRRLVEHVRTLYRKDDLSALLPLGNVESLALPGESFKLGFTPGLLAQVFRRQGQPLLPNPAGVLAGQGADRGGYLSSEMLRSQALFPASPDDALWTRSDENGHWWIPSGRVFLSSDNDDTAAQERAYARQHFFLPHRYVDPFGQPAFVTYDGDDQDPQKNHNLLVVKTQDALDNTVTAVNDYRTLQPWQITDPNGNRSQVVFDALGMVVGTAVMGKTDGPIEGDSFDDFAVDLTSQQIKDYFDAADPRPLALSHLGSATTRILYDLDRVPACAATMARETHVSDLHGQQQTKVQLSFSYSDGFGREVQKKIQAEPGPVPQRHADGTIDVGADGQPQMTDHGVSPRWVGSGWTVFNNKGKPVRQFEPFFSDTHKLDRDVRIGVSPWLFYDPVQRIVATLHPNHTWEKVVFDPWQQTAYDVNDTVTIIPSEDDDVKGFFLNPDGTARLPAGEYRPTWHELRGDPAHAVEFAAHYPDADDRTHETGAAAKAAAHASTPTIAHFDTLGRPYLTLAHNGFRADGKPIQFPTRVELDIEGNQRAVIDAKRRVVMQYGYDMLGNRIHQASMEAGERWVLNDVMGKPIRAWDSRGFSRRMTYDKLRRPLGLFVSEDGAPEFQAEKSEYGESKPDAETTNHWGKVWKVYDGAGIMISEGYDFKGNLLSSTRQLLPEYKNQVNWLQQPAVNAEGFTSRTEYDALNRPLTVTSPDRSVYRPTFNEASLLDRVEVNLRGAKDADEQPLWTPFVKNIDYNAKGQRVLIEYGSGAGPDRHGVTTTYTYDPITFRLMHLKTRRPAELNGPASQLFADPTTVQDLHYTYDPAGNITRIEDAALKTIIHDQQQVAPVCTYTYDATYRLIEATGREHIGQTTHDFNPSNRRDSDFAGFAYFVAHPNDLHAMRTYTERYEYDAVGNFDLVRHSANDGSWTRKYEYGTASLVEPAKQSNRLTKTTVGNNANRVELYTYTDAQGHEVHGCITAINSMQMAWDFKDQLQQVDLEGGGTAYYVYDAVGQRVRKVIENQNGTPAEERLYVGAFEVYRKLAGANAGLVRETLHIMDDRQRIALVETRTQGSEPNVPPQLIRYQLGNHLGSASVELDQGGGLVSYEEFHPYGTTAFQAGRSAAEVSLKRYRYTGKERDDETGFSYHGARFYAPWLGRWMSCDPAGMAAGVNSYSYSAASPVCLVDRNGMQPDRPHPEDTDIHQYWPNEAPGSQSNQQGHGMTDDGATRSSPSGTISAPMKEQIYKGLRKDLHLGTSPSLGPRSQTWPTVDIFSAARQQPPVPPVTAIKPVPSTSDMPTPDKRTQPGPTQTEDDPAQKDPSLALAPKPDPANDPATSPRQAEVGSDPNLDPAARTNQSDPSRSGKDADASDVADHPPVAQYLDALQDRAGAQAERDFYKLSPGFKDASLIGKSLVLAPIVIAGIIVGGGLLAGLQSDPTTTAGEIAAKTKKLVIVLGDIGLGPKTKIRIQYDFRTDSPPDPNAIPGIGFPSAPDPKGNIQFEFRF